MITRRRTASEWRLGRRCDDRPAPQPARCANREGTYTRLWFTADVNYKRDHVLLEIAPGCQRHVHKHGSVEAAAVHDEPDGQLATTAGDVLLLWGMNGESAEAAVISQEGYAVKVKLIHGGLPPSGDLVWVQRLGVETA